MAKSRKSLKKPRTHAFIQQHGLCYYCHQPMWQKRPTKFANRHGLTSEEAQKLKCTGEHLVEHAKGGKANRQNIVAACLYCNQSRHQLRERLSPERYKILVEKEVRNGNWHQLRLTGQK